MTSTDPFSQIEIEPPAFSAAEAKNICRRFYQLEGFAEPLVSERDQNYLLRGSDGRRHILKIASALEDPQVTDFQICALQHIAKSDELVVVAPQVVLTCDGAAKIELENGGQTYAARLVTYLPGRPLAEQRLNPALCTDLGKKLAQLDRALVDFSHPGDQTTLLWDMKRAAELERLLGHVTDAETRRLLAVTLDEFATHAEPAFPELRWQVIHNDANPNNVLSSDDDQSVVGIIDFGDMLRSPLIVELAVAAAYLRVPDGDPLRLITAFLSGYQAVEPLRSTEIQLLLTLIKVRLATTVILLAWRESLRSDDDAYLQLTGTAEQSALGFLQRLAGLSSQQVEKIFADSAR